MTSSISEEREREERNHHYANIKGIAYLSDTPPLPSELTAARTISVPALDRERERREIKIKLSMKYYVIRFDNKQKAEHIAAISTIEVFNYYFYLPFFYHQRTQWRSNVLVGRYRSLQT